MKRLAVLILIVAAALAANAYWWFSPGVAVEVAEVKVGPIQHVVEEQAKTRLPRDYVVSMPYNGRIETLAIEVGDRVAKGQVVARIVEQDLDLKLKSAVAMVDRVQASLTESSDLAQEKVLLEQAQSLALAMDEAVLVAASREISSKAQFEFDIRNRERSQRLLETGAVTEQDLEAARVAETQSGVQYDQDKLIHSTAEALQTVTSRLPSLVQAMTDRRQLSAGVAAKQLQEAQNDLAQVQLDVSRGEMLSPVDGVVLEREIFSEQTLAAGTKILRIGRLEDLEIEAEILSQDVVEIKQDDEVEITGATIGPMPANGKVVRIHPAGFTKVSSLGVEQQRVLVIIAFAPGELERLRRERDLGVDYRVWVRIIVDQKQNATQIPRTALFRDAAGKWQVFAIRNRKVQLQGVELGLSGVRDVEITSGLKPGDLVVIAPEANLASGMRVEYEKPVE